MALTSRLLNQVSCLRSRTKLPHYINPIRYESTFKFKLTEEMIQEAERSRKEAQLDDKKNKPQKALHTRENSLIMGRVSSDRYNSVIKVGIPKHRLNEFLLLYVRETDNVYALDENNDCKPGDWVLLRKQPEPIDEDVEHIVEKVVYQYGKYIDPITGRRSMGIYFEDDLEKLEQIKLQV